MIETIERFLETKSVEICYSNIDSIHISIESDEIPRFMEANKDLISDELGCLKVQAIADQGYWFDVGRYWLKKNGHVILFKNRNFNHRGATDPYIRKRKMLSVTKSDAFVHTDQYTLDLTNSFSYSKRVKKGECDEVVEFERFSFSELENIEIADISESGEILRSKKFKADLFKHMSGICSDSK